MRGHTRERRVESGADGKTAKARMTAKAQATAKVRTTGRERCGTAALYATGSGAWRAAPPRGGGNAPSKSCGNARKTAAQRRKTAKKPVLTEHSFGRVGLCRKAA